MPKLRLSEVIAEKSVIVDALSADVQEAIKRVSTQEKTLDKLSAEVAKDLRVIAEAVKVTPLDFLEPVEQLYRLKILDIAYSRYTPKPTCIEQLEELHKDLQRNGINISFGLLAVYATQVFPKSLLQRDDLVQVCVFLNTDLEKLQETSLPHRQTIAIEPFLHEFGIQEDELADILAIPKELLPWIDLSEKKFNFNRNEYTISLCSLRFFSWFCR
jgi:hypothetical protein